MPISHVSLPVSSLDESTAFYLSVLAPLKYQIYMKTDNGKTVGMSPKHGAPDFWLHCCAEKKAGEGRGVAHVAFVAPSKKVVQEFYDAALKAGAKDNGAPGERDYTKGYYAAYVLDLEGNNIECLYYQPWWLTAMQTAPMAVGAAAVGALAWYGGKAGWGL